MPIIIPLALVLCACSSPRSRLRLTYLADLDYRALHASIPRVVSPVMELSALAFDKPSGDVLAVSDDGEPPRIFRFAVGLGPGALVLTNVREIPIGPLKGGTLDTEALVVYPAGMIVAVEGRDKVLANGAPFRPSAALLRVDMSGRIVGEIALPSRYSLPARRGAKAGSGPLDNGGFESLTLSPGGGSLFAGMQLPLIEDGDPATAGQGALVRIVRF